MLPRSRFALFAPIFVAACSSGDAIEPAPASPPAPPAASAPPPADAPATRGLVPAACRFVVPRSVEGTALRCADLLVPENRDKADSRTIKVHVVVFKGKEGGVPTIELNGGPGASSEMTVAELSVKTPRAMAEYGRFLELGDLVLFDPRGVGRSQPSLSCPEDGSFDPVARCRADFAKKGVDLTGYVTREIADDVHDLAVGLGAAKVSLHGISYGTRLGLEVLRRHPSDVAAAVIDGVVPAQAKLLTEGSHNIDALLTHVFEACDADAKCAAAYPDLEGTLTALKTKLEATPFESATSGRYDWEAYTHDLFQRLYGEGTAGRLPFELHDLAAKTPEQFKADEAKQLAEEDQAYAEYEAALRSSPLGQELAAGMAADPSFEEMASGDFFGMYMSVVCSDYGQYESLAEALAAEATVRPALQSREMVEQTFAECDAWPKRARSTDGLQAVAAATPVLTVGGEVDPATPYRWAAAAAKTLSGSQLVEMLGGAHGAMDACALDLKIGFLKAASAVDTSCTRSRSLAFYYPAAAAAAPAFAAQAGLGADVARRRRILDPVNAVSAIAARARGVQRRR